MTEAASEAGPIAGVLALPTRVAARWLAPVPRRRLQLVRSATCTYAVLFSAGRSVYLWHAGHLSVARWAPLGVLGGMARPLPGWSVVLVWLAVLVSGTLAAAGRALRVTLPALAAGFLLVSTYGNSWGQLFHTEHLVTLHLVALAGAALLAEAPEQRLTTTGHDAVSGWPLRLMTALTALTYLIAGVAKLRLGGWAWLDGDALRHQVAYDNIRKDLVGSVSSPVAGWALAHAGWWWLIGAGTIVVEVGAPLAVLWRPLRRAWAVAAWLFHLGIVALMAIVFLYPATGVAYLSMFEVERWADRALARLGMRSKRLRSQP